MDVPLEIHEQMAFVDYLELLKAQGKILLYTALPNNTYTTSWKQRVKHNREGVRRGFPDVVILTAHTKKILFVEMKRVKGGTVKPEQKEWIEGLNACGGVARVCRGFEEAKEFIDVHT